MQGVFSPKDTNGNPVHAHGGQILRGPDGYWYWIGEDRTCRSKVSCYRSANLSQWEFRNHILTVDSVRRRHPYLITDLRLDVPGHRASIGVGCNIERPKVLYDAVRKRWVLWMHWELPDDYSAARCAVAVCDRIDGDYTYLGSFNPIGSMSRDCTVFQEDDGTAYFISTARENMDIHVYRLTEDYLAVDRLVRVLWPGQQREAPTLFQRHGRCLMLTSACTGWKPNQSSYAYANQPDGGWSLRFPFGDGTTYHSQPTWVFPVRDATTGEEVYWYLGDRWGGGGEDYFRSSYVLLPIRFVSDTELFLEKPESEPEQDADGDFSISGE